MEKKIKGDNLYLSRAGCLNLSTTEILGWVILCDGGCPIHYRVLSSTLGLYLLDATSISPYQLWQPQRSLDIAKYPLGKQNCSHRRTT